MSKIITDNKKLLSTFNKACRNYQHIAFATAWAGNPSFGSIYYLFDNRNKIEMGVVGLHFYQTSPEFIDKFWGVRTVRYMTNIKNDVFHPKVFLFYDSENSWLAIVGSSNLTRGGFKLNDECNVLLTSEDDPKEVFSDLHDFISRHFRKAHRISENYFAEYEERYKNSSNGTARLSRPLDADLTDLNWTNYYNQLLLHEGENDNGKINTRLQILDKCQDLFRRKSFKDFDINERRAVAGVVKKIDDKIADWQFFGSTQQNRYFNAMVMDRKIAAKISEAIDIIPMRSKGEVDEETYRLYVEKMKKALGMKDPVTICTRFLALKRPDQFVCVAGKASKNGEPSTVSKLCEMLGIRGKTITLDNYWEKVVCSIRESKWYNTYPSNAYDKMERKVYRYRVAMLDGLYY